MIKLTEAAAAHRSIRRFLDESPALGRSPDWAAVRVVEFARSKAGDPLLYCVNPPNEATGHHRPGCIITFLQNGSDRVLLARSLAEWLARLAACNGVEYAFAPGNLATCPASTREAYLSEFGEMNPGLEITTDTAHDQ